MLHHHILLVLSLLFAIGVLHMVSARLGVSYPILLVLGGLALSLVPGAPHVSLDPDLVFLIFLPPLLYEAAWSTSWHDFWRLRAPILWQAFGLVAFTAAAVALVAHAMIPGFPLALGFLLGGIISPPDAVAATSVLKGLRVPKVAVHVLEGESLINDAASLIVFRFALAAVVSGGFVASEAAGQLFFVSGLGVVVGLAVAQVVYLIHRKLPTTPEIDTSLSVMTPHLTYLAAEQLHCSGVLAVVACGLFLSFRAHEFLSSGARVQARGVWATLTFMLNGLVFILIGLQLPMIVEGLGTVSPTRAAWYAVAISLVTIAVRIVWVFPAAYLSRLRPGSSAGGPERSWKTVLVIAWAGMRGVVSLAAALAVPLTLADGSAFPHRDLILFITFVVILVTLVLQGLSLPLLTRVLRFDPEDGLNARRQQAERALNRRLASAAIQHLDEHHAEALASHESFARLKAYYEMLLSSADDADESVQDELIVRLRGVRVEVLQAQREELVKVLREGGHDHEVTRARQDQLDMEEARLRRALE